MKKKIFAVLLAACCFCAVFAGCTKDQVLNGFERAVEEAGELVLTSDRRLEGKREFGADCYVGAYSADYKDFDGFENLFGGTAFQRDKGGEVTVKCSLTVEKGSAKLVFSSSSGEERVLLDETGEFSETLELPSGSNYIRFVGDGFTGSIELEII